MEQVLSEAEIIERVAAIYQRHETVDGVARYRTALLFEQRDPWVEVRGLSAPLLMWTVEADSARGTRTEVRGYQSPEAAKAACVHWVGEDRQVAWEQVSPSAITAMMTDITGVSWR